jgi:uncharacterized membrane protein
MSDQVAIIFAHIMILFSNFLPIVLMKAVDLDEPNHWFGYRTPWSLKSVHTWRFANTKSTELLLWSAIITAAVQVFTFILLDPVQSILIAAGVMTLGIISVLVVTETGMRKRFDKDGNPKIDSDLY